MWFCSDQCEADADISDDKVLHHNTKLMFVGLMHLAQRDFTREGDGEALVSMWKIHMLQFWNRGHTHYKMIAHQFLSCKLRIYMLSNTLFMSYMYNSNVFFYQPKMFWYFELFRYWNLGRARSFHQLKQQWYFKTMYVSIQFNFNSIQFNSIFNSIYS